jgi:hypothetical protein
MSIWLTFCKQSGYPGNGHPLFTFSFAPLLASSTLKVGESMFSNAPQNTVKGNMGETYAAFWTKGMTSQPEVCIDMPRTVGEKKLSKQQSTPRICVLHVPFLPRII